MRSRVGNCFYERDPELPLVRRASVEGIGSLLLMFVATGSGLQARTQFYSEPGLASLVGALSIAGALVGLIVAFGAVSGGHFNPLITVLQWLGRERSSRCALAYIGAQVTGAILGALVANAVFTESRVLMSDLLPAFTWRLALSEFAASLGLMVIVLGCARSERPGTGPFAVGAWLAGAILATPSTSFANPAISFSAIFATGPIMLGWQAATLYILVQCGGALVGFIIVSYAYAPSRKHDVRSGQMGHRGV